VGCASGPDLLGFTGLEHAVRMKETDWATLSKMEKRRKGWTRRLGQALCFAGKQELEKKRKGDLGQLGISAQEAWRERKIRFDFELL
jgi:hypothetical protein